MSNYYELMDVSIIYKQIQKISYQRSINTNQIQEIKKYIQSDVNMVNNILNCSKLEKMRKI